MSEEFKTQMERREPAATSRLRRRSGPLRGLIVAPFAIVPAHGGAESHIEAHIHQLKSFGHDIWFLGLGLPSAAAQAMTEAWRDRFVHAPPVPWHRRKPLRKTLWNFVRKRILKSLGLQPHVDSWYQEQWTEIASQLAGRVSFDYVLVHYIFFTRIFEAFPSDVRRIIDTHDCFADWTRRVSVKGVSAWWWSCSPRGEEMALRRGDCVMANQVEESKIFKNRLGPSANVVTVGHPSEWRPLPEAPGSSIGFLASDTPVNLAGLTWFMQECWPAVRSRVPDARLLLAGPISKMRGPWSDASGVLMLGTVPHIRDFHELTTIEINPVFAGSGLKIKTIESLGFGRALVSAPEGVAGLSRNYGAFIVADSPETFAAAVIKLLQDPSARASLIARAERLVSDWNVRQRSALESLFAGL